MVTLLLTKGFTLMQKLLLSFLSVSRRRYLALNIARRILRIVHDIEENEMNRFSDLLDGFDPNCRNHTSHEYGILEDDYLDAENTVAFLDSAIEDLEYACGGRF